MDALADYVARRQREEGAANPDQAVGEARIILEFLQGPEVARHKMSLDTPRVLG